MPESKLQQLLIAELKVVRRHGLHRLDDCVNQIPALVRLAEETMGGGQPSDVERMLRAVYAQRSEGAQGTAIGLLLGLELGRRGASPTVLRKVAAERLGYHSVDTFRKKPESTALATFAALIESYAVEIHHRPEPEGQKIEQIMRLIEKLSIVEYGELVRRLRHWMTHIADPE
ncbi:hypothetical protein [Arthrobacter sp. 35W]|uniref:hypothetical protein n=1 Tax=Arthrobacter sp. 35W TaxID=1132441 RepID=UPI00047E281F|nr:hypothetical protein [Arthrobacter sp. 35W]